MILILVINGRARAGSKVSISQPSVISPHCMNPRRRRTQRLILPPDWSVGLLIRREETAAAANNGIGTCLLREGALLSLEKNACSCVAVVHIK